MTGTASSKKPQQFKSFFQKCRRAFVFVGIFSFIINMLMLTVPLYMLQIFDRVLPSKTYETLLYLSLIALIALLVLALLDMARSRILISVSHWFDNSTSSLAIYRGADEYLIGGSYGNQSLKDISTIRQFLSANSIFTLFDSPWVPVYLFVIYLLHPILGIIATMGAITLFIFALVNELISRRPLVQANLKYIHSQHSIESTLNNAEAIQAMGMLPSIIRKWFNENEKILRLQDTASKRSSTLLSLSKFFRMSLQLSILGVGAFFVIQDQLTAGGMIAASIITSRALAPVEQAIGSWRYFIAARSAYRRLRNFFSQNDYRGEEAISLPRPTGNLNLENVSYLIPGTSTPIIQNVSVNINPGETIVILGPSAAGKSTLARLMLGVWKPSYGHVRLDSADVFNWERVDFGKHIGYLPQEVDLLGGNVKENISRMQEHIDEEAVISAAKLAGAHEMILHLPNGYETTTKKYNLSGGQQQRIALARAFYGNPCLIVLDEPNANLDRAGTLALLNALKTAKAQNITVVIISHQPNVIQYADKIILLNQGRIQMMGPKEEVLDKMQVAYTSSHQTEQKNG